MISDGASVKAPVGVLDGMSDEYRVLYLMGDWVSDGMSFAILDGISDEMSLVKSNEIVVGSWMKWQTRYH